LPLAVAAFEHFISAPGCHYLSVGSMFADQQVGGSPDISIGESFWYIRLGKFPYTCRSISACPQTAHRAD
jgi:hypothetical protein